MDCSYIKSKKEMWYVLIILLMVKKVNAKRIASAKFRKTKNAHLFMKWADFYKSSNCFFFLSKSSWLITPVSRSSL